MSQRSWRWWLCRRLLLLGCAAVWCGAPRCFLVLVAPAVEEGREGEGCGGALSGRDQVLVALAQV